MQTKAISFFIALYFIVIAVAVPTHSGNSNQTGEQSGKGDDGISSLTSTPGATTAIDVVSAAADLVDGAPGSASDVADVAGAGPAANLVTTGTDAVAAAADLVAGAPGSDVTNTDRNLVNGVLGGDARISRISRIGSISYGVRNNGRDRRGRRDGSRSGRRSGRRGRGSR